MGGGTSHTQAGEPGQQVPQDGSTDGGPGKEFTLEMLDSVIASDQKATDLPPPPTTEIEFRLVIWTTSGIPLLQQGKTNVKIAVKLECGEYKGNPPALQETDVHMCCTTGNAVFNWRIVYPRIEMPTRSCTMDILCYDHNPEASDTVVGLISFDVQKYAEKVARDSKSLQAIADLDFQPPARQEGAENEASPGETPVGEAPAGKIQFGLYVYPQSEADEKKASLGRESPNAHPPLTTPTQGRGWNEYVEEQHQQCGLQ